MKSSRLAMIVGVGVLCTMPLACTAKSSPANGSAPPPQVVPPSVRLTTAESCTTVVAAVPNGGLPAHGAKGLPNLALPCLTGQPGDLELRSIVGRPTLINLWASWCDPCRKELPAFEQLAAEHKVNVLGVNTEDEASDAIARMTALGITFPSVWDYPGRLLARLPVAHALPVTVFVRADGTIAKVYQAGAFNAASLRTAIGTYLGVTA